MSPDLKMLTFFWFTAYHKNQQQAHKEPKAPPESLFIYPGLTTNKTGSVAVTP